MYLYSSPICSELWFERANAFWPKICYGQANILPVSRIDSAAATLLDCIDNNNNNSKHHNGPQLFVDRQCAKRANDNALCRYIIKTHTQFVSIFACVCVCVSVQYIF